MLGGWSGVLMVAAGAHYVMHQKCIPTNCFILFLSSESHDGNHKPVLKPGSKHYFVGIDMAIFPAPLAGRCLTIKYHHGVTTKLTWG